MFLNQFDLRIPKMSFLIPVRCLKMIKIAVKKIPSMNTVFVPYVCQILNISLKFGMPDVQVWFYDTLYVF